MSTMPRTAEIHVVVLGAGYAGMIATNRLLGSLSPDERGRVRVTVVNPRAEFVERIRLHELAAGTRPSVTRPLAEVLHGDAEVVVGTAEHIDPERRTVHVATADGRVSLRWDHLVYAVGSSAAAGVPGAREHAFLLADLAGAEAAAAALAAAGSGARVTVVGGGLTGVEAAAEIAAGHRGAEVTLLCAGPLVPTMRPAARRSLLRALRRLGVTVRERTAVAAVEAGKTVLADGRVEAFDVCVLAASFTVPRLARDSGLPVDPAGRLRVDGALRGVGCPAIVGAGDAVTVDDEAGRHLRMGCVTALPLGGTAAATVLAGIRGQQPAPLSFGFVLQCLSLGRRRGYVQVVHRDDRPRGLHVGGRAAAVVKEQICRMVVDRPVAEGRRPGTYSWPRGPRTGSAA
jgi:NADH dehydrogenase FAD-containing subunit